MLVKRETKKEGSIQEGGGGKKAVAKIVSFPLPPSRPPSLPPLPGDPLTAAHTHTHTIKEEGPDKTCLLTDRHPPSLLLPTLTYHTPTHSLALDLALLPSFPLTRARKKPLALESPNQQPFSSSLSPTLPSGGCAKTRLRRRSCRHQRGRIGGTRTRGGRW